MKKNIAIQLAKILRSQLKNYTEFELLEEKENLPLAGFHTFANGKSCLGAFKVGLVSEKSSKLWLLVIDWKSNDNYYIVIYPENNNLAPIAELHGQKNNRDSIDLIWTYRPRKGDGKNDLRKHAFIEAVGSLDYIVSLPSASISLEDFLEDIFALAAYRVAADEIAEPVQNHAVVRPSFPEGRRIERLHKSRERDSRVVRQAKKKYEEQNGGHLPCEICGFDFAEKYGELGALYIEAHHIIPLSELDDGEIRDTQIEDFAFVCANCHRMLHRRRPWTSVTELRTILKP